MTAEQLAALSDAAFLLHHALERAELGQAPHDATHHLCAFLRAALPLLRVVDVDLLHVEGALAACGGRKGEAATLLGVSRNYVYNVLLSRGKKRRSEL